MVYARKPRLGVGYRYVDPWKNLAYVLGINLTSGILLEDVREMNVRFRAVAHHGRILVDLHLHHAIYRVRLRIRDDDHLDVVDLLLLLAWFRIFDGLAFRHHKHLRLGLAAGSPFWGVVLLFFLHLRGKEAFVYLDIALQRVFPVPFAHDAAQLVEHLPYGLVALVPQLPLEFECGERVLGGRQQVHGHEPVSERKLRVFHYRTLSDAFPMMALLAFVAELVSLPVPFLVPAFGTDVDISLP